MTIYRKNLQYTQDLQKRHYDKVTKPRNYALDNKILLNNKYIKIKRNSKVKLMFFGPF